MSVELIQKIIDSFAPVKSEKREYENLVSAVQLVFDKIAEAGYVVVPLSPMIATDVADFEATIRQWVTASAEKLEDAVQLHIAGSAVAQALKNLGWHLIPPAGTNTYADVEAVIKQFMHVSITKTDNLVTVDDVQAEAIIHNLRQKGWFVLPPRS